MSVFTSLIILVLATLIQLLLWLTPGVFSIFYHHNLGTSSAKNTDDRSLSFIVGVEIATVILFFAIYSIVLFFMLENDFMNPTFYYVMTGLLIFAACLSFFTYKTRPRNITRSLIYRSEHAKNRTDTIILGFIVPLLELPITLPLYIICMIAIFNISINFGFIFAIIYVIAATLPLFVIRTSFRIGHNLADIIRFRTKHALLFNIIITSFYIIIATTTLIIGLTSGGII